RRRSGRGSRRRRRPGGSAPPTPPSRDGPRPSSSPRTGRRSPRTRPLAARDPRPPRSRPTPPPPRPPPASAAPAPPGRGAGASPRRHLGVLGPDPDRVDDDALAAQHGQGTALDGDADRRDVGRLRQRVVELVEA